MSPSVWWRACPPTATRRYGSPPRHIPAACPAAPCRRRRRLALFGVAGKRRALWGSQPSTPVTRPTTSNAEAHTAGPIAPDSSYRMSRHHRRQVVGVCVVFAAAGAILWMAGPDRLGVVLLTVTATVCALDRLSGRGFAYLDERSDRAEAMRCIREAAAGDNITPASTLTELSESDGRCIRRDVAGNPVSPHAVLAQMAHDPHRSVRTAVALNESTQEWLLLDIADAGDPIVCSRCS